MKNLPLNLNLILGVIILILAGITLLNVNVPIIWIGGFIWGISLLMRGVSEFNDKRHIYHEREIVTCNKCGQKVRMPLDIDKHSEIICPACKHVLIKNITPRRRYILKYSLIGLAILVAGGVIAFGTNHKDTPETPTINSVTTTTQPPIEPPVAHEEVHLDNGTYIKKNSTYLNGRGELNIENGTSKDAVAKLIKNNTSILSVYITANNTYSIKNISDGSYQLMFVLGTDWNSETKSFNEDTSYEKFDEVFDFSTQKNYDSIYYDTFRVTLNPVLNGTAKTDDVSPTEFNSY